MDAYLSVQAEVGELLAIDKIDGRMSTQGSTTSGLREAARGHKYAVLCTGSAGVALKQCHDLPAHRGRWFVSLRLDSDSSSQDSADRCRTDSVDALVARSTDPLQLHAMGSEQIQDEVFKGIRTQLV